MIIDFMIFNCLFYFMFFCLGVGLVKTLFYKASVLFTIQKNFIDIFALSLLSNVYYVIVT